MILDLPLHVILRSVLFNHVCYYLILGKILPMRYLLQLLSTNSVVAIDTVRLTDITIDTVRLTAITKRITHALTRYPIVKLPLTFD